MAFENVSNYGKDSGSVTDANDQTFDGATDVDPSTDQITVTGHSYSVDPLARSVVHFDAGAGTAPTGLYDDQIYWVLVVDANTIQLSTESDGAPVDITVDGSGTMTLKETVLINFPRSHKRCAFAVNPSAGKTMKLRYTFDIDAHPCLWIEWDEGDAVAGSITSALFDGPYDAFEVIGAGDYSYGYD